MQNVFILIFNIEFIKYTYVLALNIILYIYQVIRYFDLYEFLFTLSCLVFFFSLLSHMLVDTLDHVYKGYNKKILK